MIGGILARYQELLGIELYAYGFLGNHFHLLARAPKGNMDEFCENVNREISRRLNRALGRSGAFWGRRYDDQEVLSDEDLIEAFLYVNTNPSHHGLLPDSSKWPGLISFEQAIDEKPREFSFCHYSDGCRTTNHKLKLSILPPFAGMSAKRRKKLIKKLLRRKSKAIQAARSNQFLGIDALLNQEPGTIPRRSARSPRPSCYTKSPDLRRDYRARLSARRAVYLEASRRYRLGLASQFPENSYFPPLHRRPRIAPFVELPQTSFEAAA